MGSDYFLLEGTFKLASRQNKSELAPVLQTSAISVQLPSMLRRGSPKWLPKKSS